MRRPLSLEINKERMSDADFIELGFRVHQKYYHAGVFAQFMQGDYVFIIKDKQYIMHVMNDKAHLLTDGSHHPEKTKLEVHIQNEETWIKVAQRELHPLKALLSGNIQIKAGGLWRFILYWRCFTIPYRNKDVILEAPITVMPGIERIKRVVVFYASPRDRGTTQLFLEPFLEGMIDAGAQVSVIPVYKRDIKPCKGCFNCWFVSPGKCIYHDDMNDIIAAVETCDLWVLAFPTYVGNIPSGLQKALERFIAFAHPQYVKGLDGVTRHHRRNKPHAQYLVGLNVYGLPERNQSTHLDDSLRDVAGHLQFDYLGLARISNCMEKTINRQDAKALESDTSLLRALGKELIIKKVLNRQLAKKLNTSSPFTLSEMRHINNSVIELMQEEHMIKTGDDVRRTTMKEAIG